MYNIYVSALQFHHLFHTTASSRATNKTLFLTLFLHVTCMRYLESGHSVNCTSWVSVSKLPIKPPPATSQVTRHWLGTLVDFHKISADVSEPSRTIDRIFSLITSNWDLFTLMAGEQRVQHYMGEEKKTNKRKDITINHFGGACARAVKLSSTAAYIQFWLRLAYNIQYTQYVQYSTQHIDTFKRQRSTII